MLFMDLIEHLAPSVLRIRFQRAPRHRHGKFIFLYAVTEIDGALMDDLIGSNALGLELLLATASMASKRLLRPRRPSTASSSAKWVCM